MTMNIIINKEEHLFLQTQLIQSIQIGSHLYGTNNKNSDTDFFFFIKHRMLSYIQDCQIFISFSIKTWKII